MVSANRPRTPSGGQMPPPSQDKLPPIPEINKNTQAAPRRSSFGLLLRRSKSGDLGSKGSKKQQAMREQELLRQQRAIPASPPSLPVLYNGAAPPQLQTFGGDTRPDSVQIMSGKIGNGRSSMDPGRPSIGGYPASAAPGTRNGEWVDPYARTESMTHRGRYSYASSAVSTINSPRRVRRRKDPTPFNVLIIGANSSGKTSFLEFLKTSLALPAKKRGIKSDIPEDAYAGPQKQGNFVPHFLETEVDGERIGLTLWDSEGLEKNVVDLQLREMSSFLESKFEETFAEEMKVVRAPGVQDTHIHCVFLILDPVRLDKNIAAAKGQKYGKIVGGLDENLDLQVLRTLQGKTMVVPVISKADTITSAHMKYLKKTVWDSLRKANIDPLEALGIDEDDRISEGDEDEVLTSSPASKRLSTGSRIHKRQPSDLPEETPYFPLSIISPDIYEPGVIGRKFPWGFADPYQEEHCDFVRLKEAVFTEWRAELREASRELWYEGWRTSRLKHREARR